MKKILFFILSGLLVFCFNLGCNSNCSSSDSDNKAKAELPVVNDLTVDVADKPTAITLNGCEVLNVYVNGEKTEETNFVTRNGKFIFAYDYYGDVWEAGDYKVSLELNRDGKTETVDYKLTVTDDESPKYEYDDGLILKTYEKGEILQLPKFDKLINHQGYDVVYTLFDENNKQIEQWTKDFNQYELTRAGNYKLITKIIDGNTETVLGTYEYFVQPFKNSAMFSETSCDCGKENGWFERWTSNTLIKYNQTEKALSFKNLNTVGLGSDYSTCTYPVNVLKSAKDADYVALKFYVKPNETMMNTKWFDFLGNNNFAYPAGLRIFGSTIEIGDRISGSPRHDYVEWKNDAKYIRRGNQGTGVYVYKDVLVGEMSANEYTEVVINIEDFLSLNPDLKYITFAIGSVKNGELFIKDSEWLDEDLYSEYLKNKKEQDAERFSTENFVSQSMLYKWYVGVGVDYDKVTKTYDNGIKLTLNSSATTIFAISSSDFKYANELGFDSIRVSVKSESTLTDALKIYPNVNVASRNYDGESVYTFAKIGQTESTYDLDIDDLIKIENGKDVYGYLCFSFSGNNGDSVTFTNIQLIKK